MTRLLRHGQTVPREEDGAVEFRILASMFQSKFMSSPYWSIRTWPNYLQRGGVAKKRYQHCVDPYSVDTIFPSDNSKPFWTKTHWSYTDNVLLPSDFAGHIYHAGSSYDLHSIIQSGLIPGSKDVKKGRHAESKGLQFYQTRSNAIIFLNTLLAVRIAKMWWPGSQGNNCTAKHVNLLLWPQRIVLNPNLHDGRQDTSSFDARTPVDHSSKHRGTCGGGTFKETCRGEIDFRIQGLPHSTVQEQDHTSKEAVQKLIHQFETDLNRDALKADLKQNHTFNPFSELSKGMIYSMGNMEVLREKRDHSQGTVPQLAYILDERHCFLVFSEHACDFQTKL